MTLIILYSSKQSTMPKFFQANGGADRSIFFLHGLI